MDVCVEHLSIIGIGNSNQTGKGLPLTLPKDLKDVSIPESC